MSLIRRSIRSMLVIIAVATLISLGTYAYLYDSEKSSNNALSATTLDLKIQNPVTGEWLNDPNIPKLDAWCNGVVNNLKPGDKRTVTIPIWNAGSSAGSTSFFIDNLQNFGGVLTEPESIEDPANGGGLGRLIWIKVKYDNGSDPILVDEGWLDDFNGQVLTAPTLLSSDGHANWILELDYSDYGASDNKNQGDYLTFDMVFDLRQ